MTQAIEKAPLVRAMRGSAGFVFCALLVVVAAQAQSKYSIIGTVTSATDGAPIPEAHLTASPAKDSACSANAVSAEANAEAQFTLTVPCPGLYLLVAEAPGFPRQSYEQHGTFSTRIALTSAEPKMDVAFHLVPDGSIAGILLDEAGEPVVNAQVTLLDASTDEPHPVTSTTTDDRGAYEFSDRLPGFYQVAVHTQPWYALDSHSGGARASQPDANLDPSLDMTYPITWYPGVTDPASATTLHLTAGANQQADFHLSPIPSIHITLPGNGPAQSGRASMIRRILNAPRIEEISPLGQTFFEPTSTSVNEDGSIDVGGFAPGTYAIPKPELGGRFGHPSEDDQQVFTLQRDPGHAVAINPANLPTTPNPFEQPEPKGQLTGIVQLDAKPVAGALLLLVSTAASAPGKTHIRRQQSNTDGSFTFDHLPAGNYIFAAIDDGWRLNLADPAVLSPYLLHGTPIHFTGSTALPKPLQAQPATP
jgi:hypothetical protein